MFDPERRERDIGGRAAFERNWPRRRRQLAVPDGQTREAKGKAFADFLARFTCGRPLIPGRFFPDLASVAIPEAATCPRTELSADDMESILATEVFWRRMQAVVPPSAAEWPRVMVMLCIALQSKFEVTGDIADLDDAIDAGRRGIAAMPGHSLALGGLLANLATALHMRFSHSGCGGRHDIDEAIAVYRQAIMATPEENRKRNETLSGLCAALGARFLAFQDEADLVEAIGVMLSPDCRNWFRP